MELLPSSIGRDISIANIHLAAVATAATVNRSQLLQPEIATKHAALSQIGIVRENRHAAYPSGKLTELHIHGRIAYSPLTILCKKTAK